jgi:hypothetical protein
MVPFYHKNTLSKERMALAGLRSPVSAIFSFDFPLPLGKASKRAFDFLCRVESFIGKAIKSAGDLIVRSHLTSHLDELGLAKGIG